MNNNTFSDMKQCRKCKAVFPRTPEYFNRNKERPDGLLAQCKECMREYRKRNKERIRNKQKEWKGQNRERISNYFREYYVENKKKWRFYYNAEYNKDYRETNKIRRSKLNEIWRKNNKEKIRINAQRRKALKNKLPAYYTEEQWNECKKYFADSCAYCGKGGEKLQQDHFIPLSKGGEYTLNNIVPACSFCNSSKHNRDFLDWYQKQPFYSKNRERRIFKYLEYDNNLNQQLSIL